MKGWHTINDTLWEELDYLLRHDRVTSLTGCLRATSIVEKSHVKLALELSRHANPDQTGPR